MKKFIVILLRLVLIVGGGYFLAMFVIPMFGIIFNIGSIIGTVMSLAAILVGIFFNKIVAFCKKHYKSKRGKILLNTFFSIFTVGVVCFCLALGSVAVSANTNAQGQKIIIVLGCSVRGETPSYTLKSRINAAYNYLQENPDSVAVLSGGQGDGENISEAQCIYNVLTEQGIDPSRLYLEDKSTDTNENIAFSKRIIIENDLDTDIAVVSSDYHLKRATMICRKNGFENVHRISAESTKFDKPTFYLREVLGVVKEFIL